MLNLLRHLPSSPLALYFFEALQNLLSTKLRTALAILGILVGAAAVVAMVACGEMATQKALAQFESLGTDMLAVTLYTEGGANPSEQAKLDVSEVLNLPQRIPQLLEVAPYAMLYSDIAFGDQVSQSSVIAATQSLQSTIKINMLRGRFISDLDRQSAYCVIGKKVFAASGLPLDKVIGQQLKLGKIYFTIIGVADTWRENNFFNQSIDESIIIPLPAANLLSRYVRLNNIVFRLQANTSVPKVEQALSQILQGQNIDRKLFFRSAEEIIATMEKQHQIFTWLLAFIGSVSLLVGGIGIMNIMLVSVLERRREIGIRLAMGARRRDIKYMFLCEAIVLAITGGLAGIVVGIIVSYIIAHFAQWPFNLFFLPIAAGFMVSVLTGIFFGFYPALQAARLDPIQTLRTE